MARAIDRIAPSRRPARIAAGLQEWRDLAFLHWSVEPDAIRPLLPAELELDLADGRAWIGAVPFLMQAVRPAGVPRALGMRFLELNLRTYVHHRGVPGVWFFSLDCESRLAVAGARVTFGLPYFHARMRSARDGARIGYESRRTSEPATFSASYEIGARLGPSKPGTFEHFLIERYVLFAVRRGKLVEGHVHHEPYDVHGGHLIAFEESLAEAAGAPGAAGRDVLVHTAPGVDVEIFRPRRT
jgi:uncharacterized protein